MVLAVVLEMVVEIVQTIGQQRDLDLLGSGIFFIDLELGDNTGLTLLGCCHENNLLFKTGMGGGLLNVLVEKITRQCGRDSPWGFIPAKTFQPASLPIRINVKNLFI